MLTIKEKELLRKNVTDFYHLIDYNSQYFGEPFTINDYLYYFDGIRATLVSPRIIGEVTTDSLNTTISEIIEMHTPKDLVFWGDTPSLEIADHSGFKKELREIDKIYCEMVFNTKDFVPTKKYNKMIRLAEHDNTSTKVVESSYYKAEYTKLLSEVHNEILGPKSVSYYSVYPKIKNTKFLEIISDNKIIAVQIVVEALPNYICLAEIGYNKNFKNATGIAVALAIQHYLDKTKYISVGGNASKSIYTYKSEIIGKVPTTFYNHNVWCEFYKGDKSSWWLSKMTKK